MIPPLPPAATLQQARNYLTSIMKGDPDAFKVVKASLSQFFA